VVRLYRRGQLVAVLPEGLFMRLVSVEPAWVRWSDVERVRSLDSRRPTVVLQLKSKQREVRVERVFRNMNDVSGFVEVVNGYVGAAAERNGRLAED
jgi:hypothetical protein